jgi:Flp pilus assembly protein CpaB
VRAGRALIAVLAGLVVTIVVYQAQVERVSQEADVSVVVATVDIPARTLMGRDLVTETVMPRRLVPPGALIGRTSVEGRFLRDPLYKGEVVLDKHLAAQGADLSASLLIPPGKPYAFNLPVGMFLSAPPRLQLHDRIDIIAYPRGRPISEGGPIVTDLEIIDFAPRSSDNANQSTLLTIAATSEEIVRIMAAQNGQSLAIALRPFVK